MEFRQALPNDDELIIDHYLAIWESYGVSGEALRADARDRVAEFIRRGREGLALGAILAVEDERVLGSCAYQLLVSPYPEVVKPDRRLRGYIWSVYVEPAGRNRGIATQLTQHAVTKLTDIGCTDVILHAAEAAQSVYAKLGFTLAKEMRLKLREGPASQ